MYVKNRTYVCIMVLYEDNHLLIVNKRCGELVQGDATNDRTILDKYKSYIKKKYNKPGEVFLHPTHRLDRPVSGCVILARTSKALGRINTAFREGVIQKQYHAISDRRNQVAEGLLEHFIIKDAKKNVAKLAKSGQKKAKKVRLTFELAAMTGGKYLYAIKPVTGRSHQIRVQLKAAGCPILGDLKYGGIKIPDDRQIYLHCTSLRFIHPVKKEKMTVTSLPKDGDIWRSFASFLKEK